MFDAREPTVGEDAFGFVVVVRGSREVSELTALHVDGEGLGVRLVGDLVDAEEEDLVIRRKLLEN